MKTRILSTYERESTLWKNANAFYHLQDWTLMQCIFCDFSEDITECKELGVTFWKNGIDVTEEEIERRYGKPYLIKLTNKRKNNEKCYWFKTVNEANEFFKTIMKDKILGNFKRI